MPFSLAPVELYAGLNAELYLIEQHNMQFLSSTPHYDNRDTFLHAAYCRLECHKRSGIAHARAETDLGGARLSPPTESERPRETSKNHG